jgi:hypothetical protein
MTRVVRRTARGDRGVPRRWIGGRLVRPERNLLPVLIEESAAEEAVTVEPVPGGPTSHPAGFWRGAEFHRVVRVLGRRFEHASVSVRVLSDRGGAYELRRTREIDPRTWRGRWRWDLVAVIRLVSVRRLPSDPDQWIWPAEVRGA